MKWHLIPETLPTEACELCNIICLQKKICMHFIFYELTSHAFHYMKKEKNNNNKVQEQDF